MVNHLQFLLQNSSSPKLETIKLPGFNEFTPINELKIKLREYIELGDLEGGF